jgi:hypothetical protein
MAILIVAVFPSRLTRYTHGTSRALTGSRAIAAGVGPADRNGEIATLKGGLAHDVSILPGIGRHFGSQPRANTATIVFLNP